MADQVTPPPADTQTPPPVAVTPPPAASDWTSGLNEELKGYVGTKGFKDPATVLDSYRNLEKLMGAPKDRLLKLPETEDSPDWAQVYERLGTPKTAAEYKLAAAPNDPQSAEFTEWAKQTFHDAKLTGSQAEKVINKFNEFTKAAQDKINAANKTQAEQAAATAKAELQAKWGNAYEQNINIVKSAAKNFGVDDATLVNLEKTMGTVKTFEFLHGIGKGLGEASFTQGQGKGGGNQDPSTAKAQIAQLKSDPNFAKALASGDAAARAKWDKAFADAYPGEMSI